jgi:hypothetical protein
VTSEERLIYLDQLYGRLLEHRYRYYVLDAPVLEDWLYDLVEKEYDSIAKGAGVKLMEMVDFDPSDGLAIEAKTRVDNGTDSYSVWENSMLPIWAKIGRSRKDRKNENEQ